MVDLLDIDNLESGLALRAEVLATIGSPATRSAATAAITDVLAATAEVTQAPWWTPDWITDTVEGAPIRLNHQPVQRELPSTRKRSQRARLRQRGAQKIGHPNRPNAVPGRASWKPEQPWTCCAARSTTSCRATSTLTGTSRPRASFLATRSPGCRSPAFIPADRRTKNGGQGDYVQRPRFGSHQQFGPNAFIYHEGARYEVDRVSLPARWRDGGGVNITEIKRCNICGYLHGIHRRRVLPTLRRRLTGDLEPDDAADVGQNPPPRPDPAPTRKNASAPATRSSPPSGSCPTGAGRPGRQRRHCRWRDVRHHHLR